MQWRRRSLLLAGLALPLSRAMAQPPARVVAVGGSVTEVIYALGQGERLIAVDLSSVYPPEAKALPKVGYYRDLPVEGVASMQPDLLIASDQSGPPKSLQRLRELGVPVLMVPDAPTVPALRERILRIAEALSAPQAGRNMVERIESALEALPPLPAAAEWPSALSIMAHGASALAAGRETAADAIMTLSGVRNVMRAQTGYKTVSAEAAAALAPELIITTHLSVQAQGGPERLLSLPALAGTPAARAGRLIVMDDLMYLAFGPRLDEAVIRLREQCAQLAQAS